MILLPWARRKSKMAAVWLWPIDFVTLLLSLWQPACLYWPVCNLGPLLGRRCHASLLPVDTQDTCLLAWRHLSLWDERRGICSADRGDERVALSDRLLSRDLAPAHTHWINEEGFLSVIWKWFAVTGLLLGNTSHESSLIISTLLFNFLNWISKVSKIILLLFTTLINSNLMKRLSVMWWFKSCFFHPAEEHLSHKQTEDIFRTDHTAVKNVDYRHICCWQHLFENICICIGHWRASRSAADFSRLSSFLLVWTLAFLPCHLFPHHVPVTCSIFFL